jgi:Ca2+-binding RTX toxin-like protein
VLKGGRGKDALTSAAGNDTLVGGPGIDRVVEAADKNFKLSPTRLTGRDTDKLRSIERATIDRGASANRINAAKFKGRVILRGGDGDDRITGGRDVVDAGLGWDLASADLADRIRSVEQHVS